ncbi:MAG: aminotransferase class I/II-fold pyridoxal phosphate-dependent enzyme [Gemmatimonas sp.]|nr:aminotransferase class I/II-fold pyridoxal phosphate-dependent enzyme [Gemmatimonas sp.]
MPSTASRLSVFTESVIRGTTRLANQHGAINLSQGFPDFDPPEVLLEGLERATRGPFHQYAVTWGAPRFRQALAKKISHFTTLDVDPDQHLVVTCGSTEAMMVAMMTACNPGDKVIVFSPFYENYAADAILSGAEPIYVPLHPPGFGFDEDDLAKAFAQRPKAIVICNPSNPSGKVFTRDELMTILKYAEQYDTWVITDEPYEHIIYAPNEHVYFNTLPGAFERTITCNSLSKTYSITGWRLGYVHAPASVINQAKKVHDFLTVGAAAPLMEAAVGALELPPSYYAGLTEIYTAKRELFLDILRTTGLPFTEPQGAYYVMVDISALGFADDTAASEWLIKDVGVAGVPGSSFFREPVKHLIRFHFAKREDTLRAAGERLGQLSVRANAGR